MSNYEYIVVGSGSAGAVVAARLSEHPQINVLLLEAGPPNKSFWSKVPLGFAKVLAEPAIRCLWETEPEPQLNGRRIQLVQGNIMGGSSAINGMVYVRGFPLDYSNWCQLGADGWSYDDVLPYFKKAERYRAGGGQYHGESGPVGVERAIWRTPLSDAFIASGEAIGLSRLDDLAGSEIEGIGYHDLTTWNGRRSSTWQAYLAPVVQRPNLQIITDAFVKRVIFEDRKATGVEYERDGETFSVKAGAEIILSAGALKTPQILQLSGIGPKDLLAQYGIPVVHELRGVGENLMDHLQVGRAYSTTSPDTVNAIMSSPLSMAKAGLDYFLRKRGALTAGAGVAGGFVSTEPGLEAPDVQVAFSPFLPDPNGEPKLAEGSGFRLTTYQLRPESRGRVCMNSVDPRDPPSVTLNSLSSEKDRKTAIAGLQLLKRLAAAEPFRQLSVKEITPLIADSDDEALLSEYVTNTGSSGFHYSGTARIGTDEMAVVDPSLRVHGLEGLRVIDASVMPTVTSGNTNAATIMIGEKGADLVLAARK